MVQGLQRIGTWKLEFGHVGVAAPAGFSARDPKGRKPYIPTPEALNIKPFHPKCVRPKCLSPKPLSPNFLPKLCLPAGGAC